MVCRAGVICLYWVGSTTGALLERACSGFSKINIRTQGKASLPHVYDHVWFGVSMENVYLRIFFSKRSAILSSFFKNIPICADRKKPLSRLSLKLSMALAILLSLSDASSFCGDTNWLVFAQLPNSKVNFSSSWVFVESL